MPSPPLDPVADAVGKVAKRALPVCPWEDLLALIHSDRPGHTVRVLGQKVQQKSLVEGMMHVHL